MRKWGFEVKRVFLDGVKINYAVGGKGKKIIMIHGSSNDWEVWVPLAKILRKKYRVIMPDLPGFGDSDRLKKYSLEIEAFYLKKFIDKLKIKSPVLLGHSMGAELVAKFGEMYPTRVGKMILISSIFAKKRSKRLTEEVRKIYVLVEKSLFWTGWLKKMFESNAYSLVMAKFFNMHQVKRGMIKKYGITGKRKMSVKAYLQMSRSTMKSGGLPEIKKGAKALLLCGQEDRVGNCQASRKLIENKKNYEIFDIADCGHMVIWEKVKTASRKIEEFIEQE
ncbi:alpha/beta hydrolase [Patescibacteria group bacterium]|nr:alpha/beta hydrolase [Patescibacteria group bacterium]